MKKIVAFAAVILLAATTLIACAVDAPVRPLPRFTYKQYPATIVNVANIQVVQEYRSPAASPNVEHLMPMPMPNAVDEWARTRFQAGGGDGTLIITIKDASVKATQLPRTSGVKGWVTIDQAEKFDARINVSFRVEGMSLGNDGAGSVNITRGVSIGEDASIQARDQAWTDMEQAMITDLDASTQKMLRDRLPFLQK